MNRYICILYIFVATTSGCPYALSYAATEGLTADELVDRGTGLINIGENDLGLEYYDRAIEIERCNARAHLAKVGFYYLIGDIDKAFEIADGYIEACPESTDAWEIKAMLAEDTFVRDYDKLESAANGLAQIDPGNTLAIYYTGRVAFERDEFENAIEWFDEIELDNPRTIEDTERSGRQIYEEAAKYKGIAQFALGDYENAAQTFEELISIYPSPFYYSYLYIVTALNEDIKPEILKRGLRESTEEAFGIILEFYNGDTEAEDIMDLAGDPETELCLSFFIGLGYKITGDEKEAKKFFKRAVETDFTNGFEYRQSKRELDALER